MLLSAQPRPFLVNDVGEDGKLCTRLHVVVCPVIGQLVPRLPGRSCVERSISHSVPFFARSPAPDRWRAPDQRVPGFARNQPSRATVLWAPPLGWEQTAPNEAQSPAVRSLPLALTIFRDQFQPLTVCKGLTSLFRKTVFENPPIVRSSLCIGLLGKNFDDVNDREPPRFRSFVVNATDRDIFEQGRLIGHGYAQDTGECLAL